MFDETFGEAWRLRYGSDPPRQIPELSKFLIHRSIRKFSDKPVEEDLVRGLVAAAQSASTSSTLQLWSIVSIHDPERRERMAEMCANYDHVRRAPWFFAFLADHHRLKHAAAKVGEACEGLSYAEFFTMAVVDAALAAERMACAAESLGLGICYIGALRNDLRGVKELLKLPEGVFGVFGFCLGWPAEPVTSEIKPRLSQDAIWFRETYDLDPPTEEYDARMARFYEEQRMKGEVTWSMRSGRRVDLHHMTGREILKPWLEEQGFNLN
jgi:nitroreductase